MKLEPENTKILIDSSVLVGILYRNDHRHNQGQGLTTKIATLNYQPIYLDCVIAESMSVVLRRIEEKKQTSNIELLFQRLDTLISHNITWVFDDVARLYPDILDLMKSSKGSLNFNDALIALACRERNIPLIASFDADFDHISWLRRVSIASDLPLS